MSRAYTLTIRNRVAAVLIALAILGLGAVFLTVGLALLAGLAVTGGILGAGYALVRRLRGKGSGVAGSIPEQPGELDPMLEVRPAQPAIVGPAQNATE